MEWAACDKTLDGSLTFSAQAAIALDTPNLRWMAYSLPFGEGDDSASAAASPSARGLGSKREIVGAC